MKIEVDLSPQVAAKLKKYCETHGVSERDVVEHVLEEWYTSVNISPD